MQDVRRGIWVAAAVALLVCGGSATAKTAKTPLPIKVGTSPNASDVFTFVDSHGTVNATWEDAAEGTPTHLHYARKTAGAKTFTTVALPDTPQGTDETFIYETPTGELRVISDVTQTMYAWRSTDDGASWTSVDVSGLNAQRAMGVYVYTAALVDAPGGPIQYAGSDGSNGPVIQLNPNLDGVTTLTSATQSESVATVGRSSDGTVFILGYPTSAGLPFEVGAAHGAITFPACPDATQPGNPVMAAGKSIAVVADSGCGHIWTRTLGADGSVGPVVTLGSTSLSSRGLDRNIPVDVVAGPDGTFTAAYVDESGDLRVATSTDGSRWTTGKGSVPIASSNSTSGIFGRISRGAPTWYGGAVGTGAERLTVRATPLSARYRAPSPPTSHGIPHPRHATLGSLAATVPGRLPLKSFRKNGIVSLNLLATIPDTVTVSVSVGRKSATQNLLLCSASGKAKLATGKTRSLKLGCGSGQIVIGGTATRGVDAKKGDTVTFTFAGRNGELTATSRVG
jgi:hypothetical protein